MIRSFQKIMNDHEQQIAAKVDAAVALLISLGYRWDGQQWVKPA